MKRRALHLMGLIALGQMLVFGAASAFPAVAKESKVAQAEVAAASPEEAIEYFVSAMRDSDLDAAMLAFAIDRRATDYSFVKMAERLKQISLKISPPPVRFEFYRDIAKVQFTNEAATQLRNLAYSLLVPSDTPLDTAITFSDGQDVGQFATDLEMVLDPARLANLKVLKIVDPISLLALARSETYRRSIMSQLATTGGDDMEERLVLYELDGRTYQGGFILVRYGDGWQVRSLYAQFAGTRSAGYAMPMTIDEFNRWPD